MGKHDDIIQAIDQAVNKESLDDKLQLVIEATDYIKKELAQKPNREEFDDLKSDVKVISHAVTETNKDLGELKARVIKLEQTAYHA